MARFSPAVRKIKEIVRSGRLGRVITVRSEFVFPSARSTRTWITDRTLSGGGPIFDIGVHCLDTIRFVLEDEVDTVSTLRMPEPDGRTTESTSEMILKFRSGVLANIMVSFETELRRIVFEIIGSKGSLTCHNFSMSKFSPALSLTVMEQPEQPATEEFSIGAGNLYAAEIDHFSQCIMDGSDLLIPGEEGLRNQIVLDAAMEGGTQRIAG
jgi:1,5-anhydro-D-fructose reductase (1,5-anhydro-D-mannitol-forming)